MTDICKPCPFCGGKASAEKDHQNGEWVVGCDAAMDDGTWDGCVSMAFFRSEAYAIAAWNRRADLPPKVKPLVWVQSGGTHVMDHECHTVPTGYTVRYADEDGWKWTAMGLGAYGWAPTPAMAQAAAQADYEARILAALVTP